MAIKGHIQIQQDQTDQNNKRQKHDILAGIQWKLSRNKILTEPILHQEYVLAFLIKTFFDDYGEICIDDIGITQRHLTLRCYTEYQRNQIVYRCHPKYRGENAYYDWCYVKWYDGVNEETQEEKEIYIIGRIHLFVETPNGEVKAVVQSCQYNTQEEYSVFATYWCLEQEGPLANQRPKFELADVEALGDHVMVVPYTNDGLRYIHVHNRSEWPGYFQTSEPPDEGN